MTSQTSDPHSRHREVPKALACMVVSIFFFGGVPVFLRHLTNYLDSWTVNAVRYLTAALFWLPFVLILNRRRKVMCPVRPKRSIWLAALIPAVFNTVGQVGWAACPYYAEASTIGFVIRSSFLFTAIYGLILIPAERVLARRPWFLFGTVASMSGIVLMYVEKLSGGAGIGTGAVGMSLILGTAVFWGGYSVAVRKCLAGYPLRLAFGVVSLYTAGALVILALLLGDFQRLGTLPAREWVLLLSSAMVGIALGHVLLHRGIHGLGPVLASGMGMLQPFVTYLAAAVFLSESMTATQWVGGLTVVAGGLMLVEAKARFLHKRGVLDDTRP